MSLPIIKCSWYFISVKGPSVCPWGGGRWVRLLWKEGRESLSILLLVSSVRCAHKGLDWVEWVWDWERWEGGVVTHNQCQCIWRFYGRYCDRFINLGDVLDGWLGKGRIKCHILISPDLQLLATKIIFHFAKGPLKLKYHIVQKHRRANDAVGYWKEGNRLVNWCSLLVLLLHCLSCSPARCFSLGDC